MKTCKFKDREMAAEDLQDFKSDLAATYGEFDAKEVRHGQTVQLTECSVAFDVHVTVDKNERASKEELWQDILNTCERHGWEKAE